ncbi:IS4 family transposase [Rubinisphaera sp. JC750]|uniref:IS4 family transposase n=1 Tax=Rubinisphaera sp. JC750 TaxID=2898658 RepID=UPI001F02C2BC|nr:IS4 family transposase [Rubinisphaera sp. JC750]
MDVVPEGWAEREFSECELGDQRRNRRLVKVAAQMLARPDGSTPQQAESWSDCKAVYRLINREEVSFSALTMPHYQRTRQSGKPGQVRLILNDTTEVNYGRTRRAAGLGAVGRNTGRGFFLHSALMRDPVSQEVVGLAGQEILYRRGKKKGAKNTRRRAEDRESAVWGALIDQVGRPPEGVTWLHVCDRGADDYEVYLRAFHQGCGWVVRACRLNRSVLTAEGAGTTVEDLLKEQPVQGHRQLDVQATSKSPARTAQLELRFGTLQVPVPSVSNTWIDAHAPEEPLTMSVVELREACPPADATPVRWVLLTSQVVESAEQAEQILDYYSQRWAIEEYHKALKTGCRVEQRYYETAEGLESVTGILVIVAVQLLRLRTLAEQAPERPAAKIVPQEWVETLVQARQRSGPRARQLTAATMTLAEFVLHLGGLGGHLGRKGDGRPGWQSLWCGLEKLLLLLRGSRLQQQCG